VFLKERIKSWLCNLREKYSEIKEVRYKLASDFKELFQYGATSLDKLVYQSNGIVGICSDFNEYKNSLPHKFSNIHEDFKTLEIVVLKKHSNKTTYTPENLNKIIELKNKYFWKDCTQLQNIIKTETNIKFNNIESLLTETMSLKVNNPQYKNISRINYDSRIASSDMKKDITNLYTQSNKTLKELSKELELKYGMYVSASTISINARKYLSNQGLDFKNRREAKKYYTNFSTSK
jgi:hypothetical protein